MRKMMPENTSDLQGNDWLGNLKNPQGSSMETAHAEGGEPPVPTPAPTDVAPQQ